jgi:hypothetical protein
MGGLLKLKKKTFVSVPFRFSDFVKFSFNSLQFVNLILVLEF